MSHLGKKQGLPKEPSSLSQEIILELIVKGDYNRVDSDLA
jgi:hypothetical protein